MSAFQHISVLLNEAVDGLNLRPGKIYVDGTLGGAGHSYEILKRLEGNVRLIGIDQDAEALEASKMRLSEFSSQVDFVHANFSDYQKILKDKKIEQVAGVLLDLGVSSHQFDEESRGFSYRFDAPLDMRMNQAEGITAAEIVNTYSEQDLFHVIRDYGEEPFAKNIAKHIVKKREEKPIETTFELVEIIKAAIPAKIRAKGGHPAKQTFQALRLETNRELEVLKNTLETMLDSLEPGGRIAVITFHSLEDRIVKNIFKTAENPCTCPPNFPVCVCGKKSKGRVITRKPILPSEKEMTENPRSKSAKLRIFEKTI